MGSPCSSAGRYRTRARSSSGPAGSADSAVAERGTRLTQPAVALARERAGPVTSAASESELSACEATCGSDEERPGV